MRQGKEPQLGAIRAPGGPRLALLAAIALFGSAFPAGCHTVETQARAKAWSEVLGDDETSWTFAACRSTVLGSSVQVDPDALEVQETALRVAAWDAPTGRLRWDQPLSHVPGAAIRWSCGPSVLLATLDRYVVAMNPESGAVLWTRGPFEGGVRSAQESRGRVYVLTRDDIALVVDARRGELDWVFERADASPLLFSLGDSPRLLAQQRRANGAPGARMHVYETRGSSDAEAVWSERVSGSPASLAVSGDWVYGTFSHNAQRPRRVADGAMADESTELPASGTWVHGVVIGQERQEGQVLRLLALSARVPGEQTPLWQRWIPATATLDVAAVADRYAALSSVDAVRLIDVQTGEELWSLTREDDGCVDVAPLPWGVVVRCDVDGATHLQLRTSSGES